jgi:uncharacterized cupredoxin-like copper-binding protein
MKTNIKIFLLLFSATFIHSCATVKPPPGGPEDKEPPKILHCSLEDATTGFADKEIVFEFDEYINKQSVFENLFFNPEVEYDLVWKRKKLIVKIESELNPDKTYTLTLGTGVSDLKSNKLPQSYALVFSSGDKIDKGLIKGTVFDVKGENPYVFVYDLKNKEDTLNVLQHSPDLKIPLGESGEFEVKALKDGKYRLIAVDDVFKDGILDLESDAFSGSESDVAVANTKAPEVSFLFSNSKIDTTNPYIDDVSAEYRNYIEIKLSETVIADSLENLILLSLDGKPVAIEEIYFSTSSNSEIKLIPGEMLQTETEYSISAKSLKDSSDNVINETAFTFTCADDTLAFIPGIAKTNAKTPVAGNEFIFIYPPDRESLRAGVQCIKMSNDTVKTVCEAEKITPVRYAFKPKDEIDYKSRYSIDFDFGVISGIDGAKSKDTVINKKLKFEKPGEVSGISGTIQGDFKNAILILNKDKEKILIRPNSDGTWSYDSAGAGDYEIDVFIDKNENGRYDYGFPHPFEFAEPYFKARAKIKVKAGWDTDDVIIKIEK